MILLCQVACSVCVGFATGSVLLGLATPFALECVCVAIMGEDD